MVGVVEWLQSVDDRLGLSSSSAVERALDDWPAARTRWEELPDDGRRDALVSSVLRGRLPTEPDDRDLTLAILDSGERSRLALIMFELILVLVLAFLLVFGLDPGTIGIVLAPGAVIALGQAMQLRTYRRLRTELLASEAAPGGMQ